MRQVDVAAVCVFHTVFVLLCSSCWHLFLINLEYQDYTYTVGFTAVTVLVHGARAEQYADAE